jgi:DNA-binding CsgD family transcriptional regulator
MSPFDHRDAARMKELRSEIDTIRLGEPPVVVQLVPALRDLLATDVVCAYGLQQFLDDRQEVTFFCASGVDESRFGREFRAFVARQKVRWALYNPGRPEPAQRNRVVTVPWRMVVEKNVRVALDVFPSVGVGGKTQVRILVCEGPSLLGWIGALQSGACDERQRAILQGLIRPLERRLSAERRLEGAPQGGGIDAALEAIGAAAFLVDPRGRVLFANAAGRVLLDVERLTTLDALRAAVHGKVSSPRWSVTAIRETAAASSFLVVYRPGSHDRIVMHVASAAHRWGLTRRQREVLEEVAAGRANRTIAAVLGISERTVEVHVTRLFERAQAESRAHLMAMIYTQG